MNQEIAQKAIPTTIGIPPEESQMPEKIKLEAVQIPTSAEIDELLRATGETREKMLTDWHEAVRARTLALRKVDRTALPLPSALGTYTDENAWFAYPKAGSNLVTHFRNIAWVYEKARWAFDWLRGTSV